MEALAPRTQKDYRRHLAKLREAFGNVPASELEPRQLAEWMDVKRGRQQRNRQLAVLSSVYTKAIRRWHWVKVNPCRETERHEAKPRTRLIADKEFYACKALAQIRVQRAMELALKTGQRQGDILNFRWSDITETEIDDPDKPGQKKIVTELNVFQTKTGKRLGIGIDKELEGILDACWLLKGGGKDGSPYILATRSGKRYTSEGFRACWQRTMQRWMRQGGENFHFHDIRALCASKCKTPEEAMRLLGHTTLAMTLRVYLRGVERVPCLPGSA